MSETIQGQTKLPAGYVVGKSRASSMGSSLTANMMSMLAQQAGAKPKIRANLDGTFTIAGVSEATLYSPGQPLTPYAQPYEMGAVGRRFDYGVLTNTNYTPRGDRPISFADLRLLARNYDLLRIIIETRKDQMEALDWKIVFKDHKKNKNSEDNPVLQKANDFFKRPDRRLFFQQWMRACLEEIFVTDALTIYPVRKGSGDFHSLQQIDGSLIKPLLNAQGYTPEPDEGPAYQQIIKGVPAVDYRADELFYLPRNPVVYDVYGFSPVEQIIVTVNIALRRQIFQLDYYRAGSIPDAMVGVPDNWTPEQVKIAQDFWNAEFDNPAFDNIAARRKLKFIPGAKNITFAKDAVLKDEYDEWLARIVCNAFSVEPTPFVRQVNRATAETQKQQSREEGLVPLKKFWTNVMNLCIEAADFKDLEFVWDDEESIDAETRSKIDVAEVDAGIVTIDEVREGRGLEPLEEPEADEARQPTTEGLIGDPADANPADATGNETPATGDKPGADDKKPEDAKPAKAGGNVVHIHVGKVLKAAKPESRDTKIQRERLTRAVKRELRSQKAEVAKTITPHLKENGGQPEKSAAELMSLIDLNKLQAGIPAAVKDPLTRTFKHAGNNGAKVLTKAVYKDSSDAGVTIEEGFINEAALDYADERGAEMVGMKWVDGELVPNPDAMWQISDETRTGIQDLLQTAVDDGWSVGKFSDELEDAYAFSSSRAEMIARTETRLADSKGNLSAWQQSGVVEGKVWLPSNDGCCDVCQENADAGVIDVDDDFPSGDDSTPGHPNCECVIAPVVSTDDGEEAEEE